VAVKSIKILCKKSTNIHQLNSGFSVSISVLIIMNVARCKQPVYMTDRHVAVNITSIHCVSTDNDLTCSEGKKT
jgi:hypothetical protein